MRELCLACAGFVLEFIVFYAAGIVLARILKIKGDCSLTFILGYLVYFAVFELVIVPMTLKWVSLTAAAYIWAGIMALVICAAVICTIKNNGEYVPDKRKHVVGFLEAFLKYGKITL